MCEWRVEREVWRVFYRNYLLLVLVLGPWLWLSAYHLLLSLGVLLWGGFVVVVVVVAVVGHGWVLNGIRDVWRGGGAWYGDGGGDGDGGNARQCPFWQA